MDSLVFLAFFLMAIHGSVCELPNFQSKVKQLNVTTPVEVKEELSPCVCGVFMSGQFKRGSPPDGNPVLMHEHDDHLQCNQVGTKQCTSKCLEVLVKHLSNSPLIICGTLDRDCFKERAYLFVKNCQDKWIPSNLSAGREFCCKDGTPYKCPPKK